MAPAVLASPAGTGTYQAAFCSGIDTLKQWQANKKTLVPLGSGWLGLHARSSSQMAASMSTCVSLSSFDSILGSRRWSGVIRNARKSTARRLSTAAIANSFVVEEAEVGMGSEDKTDEAVPAAAKEGEPVVPVKEKFKPRVPGQKARRESPKVLAEALVPGAVFPGVVSTIQPFGAFVNFGAFTDGLVHISKLSNGYVTNVSDIVTIGQAVNVTILSVEQSSGRIALSMVEQKPATEGAGNVEAREGGSRFQQGPDGRPVNRGRTAGAGSGRQPRRDEPKKITTKLVKGQEVDGTIKNKIRSGVFVEIPEEEDGFLRYSDIPGGENMSPESAIQVGQKIKATVMKIDRGRIVLTMKPTVDLSSINRDINKGQDVLAANPFEIAFRAFNFVPEEATEELEEVRVEPVVADESPIPEFPAAGQEFIPEITAAVREAPEAQVVTAAAVEVRPPVEDKVVPEVEINQGSVDDIVSEATDALATSVLEEEVFPEASLTIDDVPGTVPIAVIETPSGEEVVVPEAIAEEVAGPVGEATVEEVLPESIPVAFAEVEEDVSVAVEEVIPELETAVESVAAVEEANLETRDTPGVPVPNGVPPETAIMEEAPFERKADKVSAALVKELRDETGAGMMDCKRALAESGGDMDKAREALRKKGLASADKKANRIASEGLVGSYVHDSRVGVLVELNCETDFVSRGQAFKSLVEDVGMQIVASQQVQYVSVEDIPPEVVNKEKELEAHRDDLTGKPEAIRGRIVEGRVLKRLNDIALLEQPYIRDDKIFLKDVVKQTVATLGENIKVRRFERYVLGEGLEKKSSDFAAEVAAQTATMKVAEPPKAEETPAPDVHSPAVVVSAGLVKELRAQTGAGMMDCKKALAANENDLEKAVESLRKKGLASADKKASRIASEGLIGTYVHDGRIGILIEVNCETDFVARGDTFKDLVETLAMQAAAYPLVQVVSVEDVPAEVVAKEKGIESGKEDLASKPEAIRDRIVDGRVSKRLAELALLEQPFIKDDKKLVKDIVRETIATLGEKIQVRRFTRFNLGEGIQKKAVDFAREVAAQLQV